ncbi:MULTISPECIES: CDP-glycerol glycerophosphotransferase family protein [Vagococcus]|uniref:CDP-glycerol: N-acetyl-beta-D-mannosaminyl-1,4-N-acetyl-D-glucosaminyldiphosphoundecaprenyl glycerophosphotransferase n=1 Tax=Vagococcus fluvialis bH819 TaxID=1255619 RepID=A0A1X6WLX9_9ENTE|nr:MULTISPECIES: CDP-glycerol glycerophosphotransferase family protein [Vagococcus]SLM85258.1 CDP-glycerol: N-acetyl-beta-D-mannosaminyl-1,4-N-acetyl-D-glucosaminyldiphosphoundecaprenyl glycerophosphotransferase [Vagococcus fluvialis bH819]
MKSIILEQLKRVYSSYVKHLSARNQTKPLKNQIVYLLSFPNNDHGLIEAIKDLESLSICYTNQTENEALKFKELGIPVYNINSYQGLKKTIQLVSNSRVILADNYFAFLGDIKKRPEQSFIQIWHATGAIKKFGLEDKTAQKRSTKDQARFKRVYQSFDYFVVGSKAMGEVFKKSYGANESQLLYLGFPRTDYFYKKEIKTKKSKQIVYLPTYRKEQPEKIVTEILELRKKMAKTTELYIKTHPHEKWTNQDELEKVEGLYLVDHNTSADELISQADILITDYSSVAFDYALIHPLGKLIFYWYDEDNYVKETGLQESIRELLPNSICHNINDVLAEINNEEQNLSLFNSYWNTYNDGKATDRLLAVIKKELDV